MYPVPTRTFLAKCCLWFTPHNCFCVSGASTQLQWGCMATYFLVSLSQMVNTSLSFWMDVTVSGLDFMFELQILHILDSLLLFHKRQRSFELFEHYLRYDKILKRNLTSMARAKQGLLTSWVQEWMRKKLSMLGTDKNNLEGFYFD